MPCESSIHTFRLSERGFNGELTLFEVHFDDCCRDIVRQREYSGALETPEYRAVSSPLS